MDLDQRSGTSSTPVARFTAFDRALEDYIKGLPDGKKQLKFIDLCRESYSGGVSAEAINDLIQQEEAKHGLSAPSRRLFRRITQALEDYSEVVGQMVSAQPLPLALIWGAVKVVVQGAARCRDMFDSMRDELSALAEQIQRITDYDDLYGDSEDMQRLFFRSYTNMIRFWHRVHKECNRTRLNTFGRSMTSSALHKLGSIVGDLKHDAESISQEASIVQAKRDNREHAHARAERLAAAEERTLQSEWRAKQSAHNHLELCGMIRNFLTPMTDHVNSKLHESNLRHHHAGTCMWLVEDPAYTAWRDAGTAGNQILCLSGPAGYGKSVLTSFAIRDVEKSVAVAYYFCHFSQPCDNPRELLRLFALQLFNVYFARKMPVDDDLCHQVLCSSSREQLEGLVRELIVNIGTVFFFIDGLDEAVGPAYHPVSEVLRFVTGLCRDLGTNVRLWCSKRRQPRPVDCYENVIKPCPHVVLEIQNHTEADVVRFIRAQFATVMARFDADMDDGLCQKDQDLVRFAENYLMTRAKGNFLWARLMTQDFEGEDKVADVLDLLRRVLGELPEKLDDLYKTILSRIKPDDRKIASKVIALVAFARRPLRIEELRDVIVLLVTRGKKNANDGALGKLSTSAFLSKFTALIEVDKDSLDSDSAGTCRLVHSSVLEFLVNKPAVLGDDRSVHITPYTIADACLLYLVRPIYSNLLRKIAEDQDSDSNVWVDSVGNSMDRHHFAQYAAKYWAKHLEDVDPQDQLRKRVTDFVASPNFQTCMQIQTLWVQGKFNVYSVVGQPSLLRVMPAWYIRHQSADSKRPVVSQHWSDYRILLHNWQDFLSCGSCHDTEPDCPFLPHRGELDRLWWASLGPTHSFSRFRSRYVSFRLLDVKDEVMVCKSERFEALAVTDHRFATLRLKTWDHSAHTMEFVCEEWFAEDPCAAPTLRRQQMIFTNEATTNWSLYKRRGLAPTQLVARPTMFSEDGALMRIGAQLFIRDEQGFAPFDARNCDCPRYFEEFASRGALVAIGSRAHTAAQALCGDLQSVEGFGEDFTQLETLASQRDAESDCYEADEETEDDGLSESEVESSSDVYESWSEGSTDDSGDLNSDFDEDDPVLVDSASSVDESDEEHACDASDCKTCSASDAGSVGGNDVEEDAKSIASDDPPPLPESVFPDGNGADSDDEDPAFGDNIFGKSNSPPRFRRDTARTPAAPQIMLTVFEASSSGQPQKLFQYAHPLSTMLYASPPAIHPQKSLVVWPLGAGDVLFADFFSKTYFVRKLRTSAPRSRHISVKVHFSPCGKYLHLASLEAHLGDGDKKHSKRSKQQPAPELQLYLLVSTYRLSTHKTTHSPPTLLHRAKAGLGSHRQLEVLRLPFTFTWTAGDLFVTHSASELDVLRIALFGDANECSSTLAEHSVLVPKNKIFLPDSAHSREVYFIPPAAGAPACVIVGSESRTGNVALVDVPTEPELQLASELTGAMIGDAASMRGMLSPPVGCFVQETEDLGGWVRSHDVPLPKGQGVGKLNQRREKFDPVEDCDVEPFLRFV